MFMRLAVPPCPMPGLGHMGFGPRWLHMEEVFGHPPLSPTCLSHSDTSTAPYIVISSVATLPYSFPKSQCWFPKGLWGQPVFSELPVPLSMSHPYILAEFANLHLMSCLL